MFILKKIFGKKVNNQVLTPNEEHTLDKRTYEDTIDLENDKNTEEYEIVEIEILPEKIICPDCGGITLQGLDFCDKCAGELQ